MVDNMMGILEIKGISTTVSWDKIGDANDVFDKHLTAWLSYYPQVMYVINEICS